MYTIGLSVSIFNFLTSCNSIEANATFNNNQKHTFFCNSEFNPDVYDRFTFRNKKQTSIKSRMGFYAALGLII